MIREIEPKPWHCGQLARRLRVDHDAVLAELGAKTHRELRSVFDASVIVKAWEVDGKLGALGGVVGSMASPEGRIWLAMTDDAMKHPVGVARRALAFIEYAMKTRSELSTFLLAGDKDAMNFALFLGFITERTEGGHRVMSIKRRKVA